MMKRLLIGILTVILSLVLVVTAGCNSDVPTSYPKIEFPPTNGQSTSIVVDDIIDIQSSQLWHKSIDIPPVLTDVKIIGWCTASGGFRNDIKVLVLNDIDFHNYRNFSEVKGVYQSQKTTVAEINAEIKTPGKYHLVISNWFSEFSSKKVIARVYLYWSVQPVERKISADGEVLDNDEIPADAYSSFEFSNKLVPDSFTISKGMEKTSISANITDTIAIFVAPSYTYMEDERDDEVNKYTYKYRYDGSNEVLSSSFMVIPSAPSIGRGLVVSSSSTNAPPEMETIGNRSAIVGQTITITIKAIDPDDDPISYYACNLPPEAVFDTATGKFTWVPPQGSAGNEYFVHFEASDGVLNDFENITIEVE
jgi:hypothetical protein